MEKECNCTHVNNDYVTSLFLSLFNTPKLHVPSKKTGYRNKITYSLPLTQLSDLAMEDVNQVSVAVQNWSSSHRLREVMVKLVRSGHSIVRVTVIKDHQGECAESSCLISLRDYLLEKFPTIECICYNLADESSTARPSKEKPRYFLTEATCAWETTPNGFDYRITPDTFSEVNHEVETLQCQQTSDWLHATNLGSDGQGVLLASGRDISSFGLSFGTLRNANDQPMFVHTVAIQHCPLVHADAVLNFRRHQLPSTVMLYSKPEMVKGFRQHMSLFRDKLAIGVMTGGRKGLDPSYIQYLCHENKNVICIIYNSCATKSLIRDMKGFMDGGFYVDDFKSYDFLPGTAYTASLTKLVRRQSHTLILPVGPAGVGKSTMAQRLLEQCGPRVVRWWQRDAVFSSLRNTGVGLAKSKHLVHQSLLEFLRNKDNETKQILIVDSTNGSPEARELYIKEAAPDQVILVVFQPVNTESIVESLLELTKNRLGDQNHRHPSFPDSVEKQRQKHLRILKGLFYPETREFWSIPTIILRCNPLDEQNRRMIPYSVFLEVSVNPNLIVAVAEANTNEMAQKTVIGKCEKVGD